MRLLHTSDWHLGARTGPVLRAEDHDRFLAWLLDRLTNEPIDSLIVAGDVFDHPQPSAEAQRQYYRFLGAAARTGVRNVVVVGGNHDSASRLDAPAEVLASLDVHVVGGLPVAEHLDRCLVPLCRRGTDEVGAVCVAIPYVHEYRLGVRTTDPDASVVRAAFRQAFSSLYAGLFEEAARRWPGVPVVGTGHLTLGSVGRDDYPQEIHQVGRVESLPSDLLDPRLAYVALGHIHRSGPVTPRAWYSGSPIALSVAESKTPRRVLEIEVEGAEARVLPVVLPPTRDVYALRGTRAEVLDAVARLDSPAPLPPLLHVTVMDDAEPITLDMALQAALQRHPEARRPLLVDRQHARTPTTEVAALPPLAELTPVEVLAHMASAADDTPALTGALQELASLDDDAFEALLLELEAG